MKRSAPRPAHPHRFVVPTRTDVAARLAVLAEHPSAEARAEAAAWAGEYVIYDDPQVYPAVQDPAVREAIKALGAADLPTTDRPFLYGPEDFRAWRAELLAAPDV